MARFVSDRLVKRIQCSTEWRTTSGLNKTKISLQEFADLRARVRRLRAQGDQFSCVRLSDDIAERPAKETWMRVGGESVAREV